MQDVNKPLLFGKYKGTPFKEVFKKNPKYIKWCIDKGYIKGTYEDYITRCNSIYFNNYLNIGASIDTILFEEDISLATINKINNFLSKCKRAMDADKLLTIGVLVVMKYMDDKYNK